MVSTVQRPSPPPGAPPRVLAVADTDSYLKWGAATLDAMPAHWSTTQVVVDNPVRPSAAQIAAATARPVTVLSRRALLRRVRDDRPDVVLLACTGPVVAALTAARPLAGPDRPVLVTGLPGISVPATRKALRARSRCDLMLLHSHREVAEFRAKAERSWPGLAFGLARLPFLPDVSAEDVSRVDRADGDLVFAAQAKFPVEREDRERVLLALAGVDSPVVKLRAVGTEEQTHRESWSYARLREELVGRGQTELGRVRLAGGPMSVALGTARGLATVSSTAALEAMALGLPVLLVDDFGVDPRLANVVFEGSGCFGTLADLEAGRLRHADPAWLAANYFHPAAENDWLAGIDRLLAVRTAGALPVRPRPPLRGRLRRRLRLAVPPRLRPAVRVLLLQRR